MMGDFDVELGQASRLRRFLIGDGESKKKRGSELGSMPSWMAPVSHGYYVADYRPFRDELEDDDDRRDSDSGVVVQREEIEGLELWYFGVFDPQIGDGVAKYMQSNLFDKKPKQVQEKNNDLGSDNGIYFILPNGPTWWLKGTKSPFHPSCCNSYKSGGNGGFYPSDHLRGPKVIIFDILSFLQYELRRKSMETMRKAYAGARGRMREAAKVEEKWKPRGSASALVINGERLLMAYIGDYRAVVCRDGEAYPISRRHWQGTKRHWSRKLFPGKQLFISTLSLPIICHNPISVNNLLKVIFN